MLICLLNWQPSAKRLERVVFILESLLFLLPLARLLKIFLRSLGRLVLQARYRALFGKIDATSKAEYAELVRKMAVDLCRENDEALVQRMHALAKGKGLAPYEHR